MNTIKAMTTAILLISTSFAAAAKGPTPNEKIIPAPVFSWGSPEDLDPEETELLKNSSGRFLADRGFSWGSADDLDGAALELLKVRADVSLAQPAFRWGTAEDLGTDEVETLRLKK
ncbi:MAG TPA: hypothetical protein VGE15_06345 [Sphingobacteriaceae bacterium]